MSRVTPSYGVRNGMNKFLIFAIFINLLSVAVFLLGLFLNFQNPKNKALFGYLMIGNMILYLFILSVIIIYELLFNHSLLSYILIFCVISPFIIGKLVKFETLKKYTLIQILSFIVSLGVLVILYKI